MEELHNGQKCCKCPHHGMFTWGIFLIALVILLGNLGVFTQGFVGIVWPIILGLIAIFKMCGNKCKCC
jgi:hypothetical protein